MNNNANTIRIKIGWLITLDELFFVVDKLVVENCVLVVTKLVVVVARLVVAGATISHNKPKLNKFLIFKIKPNLKLLTGVVTCTVANIKILNFNTVSTIHTPNNSQHCM
jgi:hypothetical protein